MQPYTTAPPASAPGLDLFAAAWLERWTAHGGSLLVNPDGTADMWARVSVTDVPSYEEPPAEWTDEQRYRRLEIDGWMHCGRTRELMELLKLVPGGREAVKQHVRTFPSFDYQGGIVGIV